MLDWYVELDDVRFHPNRWLNLNRFPFIERRLEKPKGVRAGASSSLWTNWVTVWREYDGVRRTVHVCPLADAEPFRITLMDVSDSRPEKITSGEGNVYRIVIG